MKFDKYFWKAAAIVILSLLAIIIGAVFATRYEWVADFIISTIMVAIVLPSFLMVIANIASILRGRREK